MTNSAALKKNNLYGKNFTFILFCVKLDVIMQEAVKEKAAESAKSKTLAPQDVLGILEEHRVIAQVRSSIFENVEELSGAIIAGGVQALLISIAVPQRFRFIETLSQRKEDILVGASHIVTGEQAQKAIEAGAKFISTAFLSKDVTNVCRNSNTLVIQGVQTPTEVMEALHSGADMVQLFPVEFLGGPNYLRAVREPLPPFKFVVGGGVTLDNMVDYIRAGASSVLVDESISDRGLIRDSKWKDITERAKNFVQKIASLKTSK